MINSYTQLVLKCIEGKKEVGISKNFQYILNKWSPEICGVNHYWALES